MHDLLDTEYIVWFGELIKSEGFCPITQKVAMFRRITILDNWGNIAL